MDIAEKLAILADAAKYDASCASSGAPDAGASSGGAGIGSTSRHGHLPQLRARRPLHLAAQDPADQFLRLRLPLLRQPAARATCARARFTVDEVVKLTLDFYRRNYIEGLFLSSGIIRIARLHDGAARRRSRARCATVHDFRGYIHLKTIPEADERLIARPGATPTACPSTSSCRPKAALTALAPEKNVATIKLDDGDGSARIATHARRPSHDRRRVRAGRAEHADDRRRRRRRPTRRSSRTAETLYAAYRLRRVYYSAFSPDPARVGAAAARKPPPLVREHRLYQADWLLRTTVSAHDEIVAPLASGQLALDIDPKLAWALAHREAFPVDVNAPSARDAAARARPRRAQRQAPARACGASGACGTPTSSKLRCDVRKAEPFVDHGRSPARARCMWRQPALRARLASPASTSCRSCRKCGERIRRLACKGSYAARSGCRARARAVGRCAPAACVRCAGPRARAAGTSSPASVAHLAAALRNAGDRGVPPRRAPVLPHVPAAVAGDPWRAAFAR